MTNDINQGIAENALKSSEAAVREAVAEFGAQHPEVLKRLERYVTLLRRAGKTAHADKLEEKAKTLRQLLGAQADAAYEAPPKAATPQPPTAAAAEATVVPAQSGDVERPLFNSRGENVAVELKGHLYTPDGKYMGSWNADMEAYIGKDGRYLGHIVENDRLAKETAWRFRHLSFGRGYEGDRTGWRRAADVQRVLLPHGFEDVDV